MSGKVQRFSLFKRNHSQIHRLLDQEQNTMSMSSDGGYGWKQYYNLSDIYNWLDQMLEKYPHLLTHYNYGKSYEGRPLRAVKISHKKVGKFSAKIHVKHKKRISNGDTLLFAKLRWFYRAIQLFTLNRIFMQTSGLRWLPLRIS